ncbi:MAG: helix-turn-helix transcriptional regulator, partial [Erysipelotrichaceae bacterium]|nr:helix-turn-helix transcriptional regulator [Erysipelotrichaceae bacterium]
MSFSGYCNQVRKSEKLSQVKMSSILGISLSQYRNLEKERSILPRFEVFQRLADYLNKDVSEVVYDVFFF